MCYLTFHMKVPPGVGLEDPGMDGEGEFQYVSQPQ